MHISKRQILELIYEQQVQNSKEPSEVKPEEDVWGTGEDLVNPIDHQEVTTGKPVESGIEVEEIVEKLRRRMLLKRIIREQVAAAEEELMDPAGAMVDTVDVVEEPAGEERASASQQSLRNWLKDTAGGIAGMGIADNQVPALIAAMDDLMSSAQSGKMASREDRVRQHIDTE